MKKLVLAFWVLIILNAGLYAQETISGKVTSKSDGLGIPGVNVTLKSDPSIGTSTDIDGNYSLVVPTENEILVFSSIGMQTIEISANEAIKIVMQEDSQILGEVVVVGFGTQKKENLTGAVSSVGTEELTSRPVNNIVEALQGVVPGMNISTGKNGGALNSSKNFNIRGTGTIGEGSKVSPLVLIDGMEGDIEMLNPNDVENISILKDAASASIYGSRAPGGVILITTKKGKEGKVVINYNNSFRFVSPLNMPKIADSYKFALAINDQLKNGGQAPMYSDVKLKQILDFQQGKSDKYIWERGGRWNSFDDPERKDIMPTANTDWLRTHFGDSFTHEHSLSINGGNQKTQYYLSANYLNQEGLLKFGDDTKERYTANARINTKITDWLEIGYISRFSRSDYEAPSFTGGSDISGNVFYFDVIRYWPVIPLKDPNGFYNDPSKVAQIKDGGREKSQNDIISQQLSFVLEPVKDWKINAELNYKTNTNFTHRDFQTAYAYDVNKNPYAIANNVSSVFEYTYKSNFFNPNIYTEYSKEVGDGHYLKGLLGFQSELYKNRSFEGSQDHIIANIPTLNTTLRNAKIKGGYGNWSTVGFFGRLNYDYKGRYLAEANLRYDGTSRFLRENRWNWFPSFSLGWNIAREAFFQDLTDIFGTLKLRASWGELGNQNTDNWYPFYRTMGLDMTKGDWLINGKRPNVSYESDLVASSLTWEKTQTLDIGLDVAMLQNRLSLTFDWFQRKAIDMVGPAPELPNILGKNPPKVNNLNMTSKGWEFQVSWRDKINEFSYGATLSLSDNTVKIDKYPNPSRSLFDKDSKYMNYPGRKLGDIWGYETVGIAKTDKEMQEHLKTMPNGAQDALGSNWAAGDIMYKDLNGDGKVDGGKNTVDDSGDRKCIGNTTPRYNFGLNLNAAYKNFDLKVFFQGTLKRDYMPGSSSTMYWGAVGYWQTNFFKPHLNYFRPENTDNPLGANVNGYFPRPLESSRNRKSQTGYLQNAAYARLKNITLGYTLPKTICERVKLSNLRLFISGENLLTITDLIETYDPETIGVGNWDGATYPLNKTISLGLSITL